MDESITNQSKDERGNEPESISSVETGWLIFSAVVMFCLVFGVLITYFSHFGSELGDQGEFGTFGDFLGGTLNPIFGFSTVVLLVWSIQIQVRELKDTRKEFKRSADAQEQIEIAQKMELEFYKKKGSVENLKNELADSKVNLKELLNMKLSLDTGVTSLHNIFMGLDLFGAECLGTMTKGYDFSVKNEYSPIVFINSEVLTICNEYLYCFGELIKLDEYELFLRNTTYFTHKVHKIVACNLVSPEFSEALSGEIVRLLSLTPTFDNNILNKIKQNLADWAVVIVNLSESNALMAGTFKNES